MRTAGIEPAALGFGIQCSTTELSPLFKIPSQLWDAHKALHFLVWIQYFNILRGAVGSALGC